jgi:hypothetical protein
MVGAAEKQDECNVQDSERKQSTGRQSCRGRQLLVATLVQQLILDGVHKINPSDSVSVTSSSARFPHILDSTARQPSSPILVNDVRTKRMSTGLHPLLPLTVSSELQDFQNQGFASKYFATKQSGMLRSKVPWKRIMEWQKQPLTSPLLLLARTSRQHAITTFKVIQHVMGERDKAVEDARPVSASPKPEAVGEAVRGDDMAVLEEIRWMIQLGCSTGGIRDEI